MSDILDPIPSPDGAPEEEAPKKASEPQDLPIEVSEPASLPIDVMDKAPVKKAAKPAKPAASAPASIPTPVEPVKSDADKKKKTWIIVGVIALLLICCCCVMPFILTSALPENFWDEILNEIESGVMLPLFVL